jgi:hypothetical protein
VNKYSGTIKTSQGERLAEVYARDFGHAKSLLEQQGKLLYAPKKISG